MITFSAACAAVISIAETAKMPSNTFKFLPI
jgi:hypothetical protein